MSDTEKTGPGRQHLLHLTPVRLAALVGPNTVIAVSQSSLKKFLGEVGVKALVEEEKANRAKKA